MNACTAATTYSEYSVWAEADQLFNIVQRAMRSGSNSGLDTFSRRPYDSQERSALLELKCQPLSFSAAARFVSSAAMWIKYYIIAVAGVLFLGGQAQAHGFAIYVSTPVSPPVRYEFVSILALSVLFVANILLFKRVLLFAWDRSIIMSFLATAFFAVSFFVFGALCAGLSTAPPPGLGLRYAVYRGFGWGKVGGLFVTWNVLGLLFLLANVVLFGRLHKRLRERKVRIVLYVNVGAYLLSLVPYIATGALAHGWAGTYVGMDCNSQIRDLVAALGKCAEKNDRKFPVASSFDELYLQIAPYLEKTKGWHDNPIHFCPVGWAFERAPTPYVWNEGLSGRTFDVNDLMENDVIPISCQYCQRGAFQQLSLEDIEAP